MDNQFFVHLSNHDSSEYFRSNTVANFTVKLPETIQLEGRWYVGLSEIVLFKKHKERNIEFMVMVLSDICEDSIMGNNKVNMLRMLPLKAVLGQIQVKTFANTHYHLVKKQSIERIEISIKVIDGSPTGLDDIGSVRCSLHFRKAAPFIL